LKILQAKVVEKKKDTFYIQQLVTENCAFYEVMWKKCSIDAKATDTHPEYVILAAFPWQQWLLECPFLLHLHVHCLSCLSLLLCR